MKSAVDHLWQIHDAICKADGRVLEAIEREDKKLPKGAQIEGAQATIVAVFTLLREHELLYGNGGPEPIGILNVAATPERDTER